jgi:hypothetical protein
MERCESCGALPTEKHKPTDPRPTMEMLNYMVFDGVAQATDGCNVEPDGTCEHGHESWLMVLGFI